MGQGFPATLFPRCKEKKQAGKDVQSPVREVLLPLSLWPPAPLHVPSMCHPQETHNTHLSSPLWGYSTFVVSTIVSPDRARTIAVLVFWNEKTIQAIPGWWWWGVSVHLIQTSLDAPLVHLEVPSGDFPGGLGKWLRSCAPNAGGLGWIPDQETRSHIPQPRPGAAK